MNQPLLHIAPEHRLEGLDEAFFQSIELPLQDAKEDVWQELTDRMELNSSERKTSRIVLGTFIKYAVAATVLLLITAGLWAITYSKTVHAGHSLTQILPDGSTVALSPQSSLSFRPYWWFVSRDVLFEGEAYFQVEKGSSFRVVSEAGTTEVLGTSFTINTNAGYEVYCETGKVWVSNSDGAVELRPGEFAKLNKLGQLELSSERILLDEMYLADNTFSFKASALDNVLKGLAKHYNVQIEPSESLPDSLSYTGFFTKPDKVEDALHIVSLSLGLTFEKVKDGTYKVSK